MLKSKKFRFVIGLALLLLAIGCNKPNPAEDVYEHLETAVSLEATFEEQQEPLSKAENDEYELYDQILSLADLEEIKQLAIKAEELAVSRKAMIETERDSIEAAYNEFSKITVIIETIEEETLKDLANQLVTVMDNRYQTYMNLYNEYKGAIDLDIELYNLIQKEDLTIEELEAQHEKVNASYEKVNDYKDQFNQYTIEYNELKRNFYEQAELEVVYN